MSDYGQQLAELEKEIFDLESKLKKDAQALNEAKTKVSKLKQEKIALEKIIKGQQELEKIKKPVDSKQVKTK